MQILEKPQRDRSVPGPRNPGWWRKLFHREGTVVEYLGEVWRLDVYAGYDGSYRAWTHIGSLAEYERERRARYVEATVPTRGPKGRAGDSGSARYFSGGTPR